MPLHLSFLGTPQIHLDNQPVELERRKAVALLAYLAVTGQMHNRESLATFFFPDVELSRSLAYLRNTLWTINKQLGDGWLDIERETVDLHRRSDLWVDVNAFQQYAKSEDFQAWQSAVALYRDNFMRGFSLPDSDTFEEWQFFQAESLRQLFSTTLEKLVRGYIAQNRYEEAIPHARRWLALDRLNESAHRNLMRLYDWTGQRALALRQYQECEKLLQDELGIVPEEPTTTLYQTIMARQTARQTQEVMVAALDVVTDPFAMSSPSNLPIQSTPFISRERDLAEVTRLMQDPACRLLTLIGQGGIGKTRLSIQSGESLREVFPDGVYFVALAPATSAESLIGMIAEALRLPCKKDRDVREDIFDYARDKQLLLILDNFEHLLAHIDFISQLLSQAPCCKCLVTSRERLNLREEWIYELDGLSYPQPFDADPAIPLENYGAVQLFLQSARQVQPNFHLTDDNAPHIKRICQLVEGLPLGIELATGWLQMLPPQDIVQEIQHSFDFLSATLHNLPPRHRSMRAMFESSWERLTPQESHTLCRLSVFLGGFDRVASQQVASADLPILLALVNKSLIRRADNGRFDMHELLRQFAEEKLRADANAYHITKTHHSQYYAQVLAQWVKDLGGAHQIETLNRIEREMGNLRLAWSWACLQQQAEAIYHMLLQAMPYFIMRSRVLELRELCLEAQTHLPEGMNNLLHDVLQLVLMWTDNDMEGIQQDVMTLAKHFEDLPDQPETAMAFMLLHTLTSYPVNNPSASMYWVNRAFAIFEATGDSWAMNICLRGRGWIIHQRMDYETSKHIFEQAWRLSQEAGDIWNESENLKSLAEVAYTLGDYVLAEEMNYESLHLAEKVGDLNGIAVSLSHISDIKFRLGKYDEADALNQRAIAYWQALGNVSMVAWRTHIMAQLHIINRRYGEAENIFKEIHTTHTKVQSPLGAAWVCIAWAWCRFLQDNFDGAEMLLAQALAHFEARNHLWGFVSVDNYRAEIACSQGDIAQARVYIERAIQDADTCRSIMFQTRNWVTLARVLAGEGDIRGALNWLEKAIAHHATWADVRERALQLQTEWLIALARA